MNYEVVIIGAGPAGLSCAGVTAAHGLSTLLIERQTTLGRKVCGGGITWNGLLKKLEDISRNSFSEQHVFTRYQRALIREDNPIIATVNRIELGQLMARKAKTQGAEIRTGCYLTDIGKSHIRFRNTLLGTEEHVGFNHLVGADGSSSSVRKYLQLPVVDYGIGLNYQISGHYPQMEWHLNNKLFGSGYGWIFPHRKTTSIGAYADSRSMTANTLKKNCMRWGGDKGFELAAEKLEAGIISFDYRGWEFPPFYLAGDAAGLASGLTGEGIYPAIISGTFVGKKIVDPLYECSEFIDLLKNHKRHRRAVRIAGSHSLVGTLLSELTCYCLKKKIITFSAAEMAH